MRSKMIAAFVSVAALCVPATALADSSQGGNSGAGGAGQAQLSDQAAKTLQLALSQAKAKQNAVNTNAPVNVAGGDVSTGDNNANQTASNGADSSAKNKSHTDQTNTQTQTSPSSGSGCGCGSAAPTTSTSSNCGCGSTATPSSGPSCQVGCGGIGQAQLSSQWALTGQLAGSKATAAQNAVNANAPVNVAGGNISTGDNNANQTASNGADSSAKNKSNTDQSNTQTQTASGGSCSIGCGGSGQAQISGQEALTLQAALSKASANQNAVNANVPVNIAGGNISTGDNNANQTAGNGADSSAGNHAGTSQDGGQTSS